MFDYILCPQCGEPTEEFPDGVCSSCSIANQMELDSFLEEHDRWERLSEAQRDRAIRHAMKYAEHYTEPEDDDCGDTLDGFPDDSDDTGLAGYGEECRQF